MFIRTKTTPNSPRQSVQIVEGYRDKAGKVKQRIVHYVGIARHEDELEKLKAYGEELIIKIKAEREGPTLFDNLATSPRPGRPKAKRLEVILPPNKVNLDDVVEEKRLVEGIHEIAGQLYDDLGFGDILSRGHKGTLKDIVLMRLSHPTSKRASSQLLEEQFGKDVPLERVYRMMDQLELQIPKVQKLVRGASLRLLKDKVDVLLFDVTTLYLESVDVDDLRNFGYSKDQKYHCTQVVLALATTGEGLPIGYELFEGNFAEVKTLQRCLASWKDQGLEIGSICLAGDSAMFSKANLSLMKEMGITYVVAAPLRKLSKEIKAQILDAKDYRAGLVDRDIVWSKEIAYPEDQRLIVSYSTSRARKDVSDRQRLLDKLTKKLGEKKNLKKLVSNQGYLRYIKEEGKTVCQLNETKIHQEEQWDGMHGIVSNAPKTQEALALVHRYRRLWVIEESFRINKHTLKMRPIYHFKDWRIKAHIAICYMSFALMRHLEYRIKITQKKLSPQEILTALNSVQASILIHKKTGDRYRLPSSLKSEARMIYQAFGIKRSQDVEVYLP
jgi:transposase